MARLWLDVEPTSKRAQQMMASVMIQSNQLDDLAPNLTRMLELEKDSLAENLLGLNRMFARNPDRQAVFRLIDKVCLPFFGTPEAHYAVSMAASSAGVYERALAEVQRALELRPDWELAALLEAQLLSRESPAKAINFLQDFVARNPGASDLQLNLARVLIAEKRYSEARQQFDQLLKDYPDKPEVVYSAALLALQQNDNALAERLLKKMLTLDIPDKNPINYYLGQIAEDGKRSDEALAYYAQVGTGEHYLPALFRSAHVLAGQGQLEAARKLLSEAKIAAPEEQVQVAITEASLLREAKQPQAAFELLDQLLTKQPKQADLLYETALLAEKLGRLDVLESRLHKLIELRPDSAQAYNALGYSYADRNLRLPEAQTLIEKALKLTPDDPFILDSLGWVLYRRGDLAGALTQLEQAYTKRDDPEIAAHLGEVLWALGRKVDAQRIWRESQQKYPTSEALLDAIKKFNP
jgi:tetratricopeptide (TPR) repeat protein